MRNRFALCLFVGTAIGLIAVSAAAQRPGRASGRRRPGDLRSPDRLKLGDLAPDFTLKSPDGSREVTLSEFRGKKPVALVFGSYT